MGPTEGPGDEQLGEDGSELEGDPGLPDPSFMGCCSCLVAQSCPTLSDPVDHSSPGSPVHGVSQAGTLEWDAISFSKGSSPPGSNPGVLHWQADSLH